VSLEGRGPEVEPSEMGVTTSRNETDSALGLIKPGEQIEAERRGFANQCSVWSTFVPNETHLFLKQRSTDGDGPRRMDATQ